MENSPIWFKQFDGIVHNVLNILLITINDIVLIIPSRYDQILVNIRNILKMRVVSDLCFLLCDRRFSISRGTEVTVATHHADGDPKQEAWFCVHFLCLEKRNDE